MKMQRNVAAAAVAAVVASSALATMPVLADGIRFVPQPGMEIGGFWGGKLDLLEKNWLPHCGDELLRAPTRGAMRCNLVDALCLALERHPGDRRLRKLLATCVERELASQQKDGYVGSTEPRYANLDSHEFYLHGYFLEAAARYTDFTRGTDRRFFEAGCRLAEHLDSVFGPPPKRTWTNGHPGLEKALLTFADAVRRYGDASAAARYERLSQYFIRHQHDIPELRRDYAQSHIPAVDMKDAVAHAVRATYFYAGMTGVGRRCGDAELAAAAIRLFESAIDRKSYITGGFGSKWEWEAFDADYELPNTRGYLEGCASCGMYDWCTEMTMAHGPLKSEAVRERLMYNLLLGVFDREFRHYSYPNPPNGVSQRFAWHTIPCCVANVPRVLEDYKNRMWAVSDDGKTLYLCHFIDSRRGEATVNGVKVRLDVRTDYPKSGRVMVSFKAEKPVDFKMKVRFPDRAESALYTAEPSVWSGLKEYPVSIRRSKPANIRFELPMPLQRVTCDERVAANRGLVAWQKGPVVFAWEGDGFSTRVPYHQRQNAGGASFVWKPADGSQPDATLVDVPWPCGKPIRDDGSLVPSAKLIKGL